MGDRPITRIKVAPQYCPGCGAEARCEYVLTSSPPIYQYSCGCRIQYETAGRTHPLDVKGAPHA